MKKEEEEEVKTFRYKNLAEYKKALDAAPKAAWLKSRDLGGNKSSKYVPLFVQQAVADVIFREFHVIDEKYQVVVNEVLCTVKVQALPDFPHADMIFFTGSASKPIQMDSGTPASKFPIGKKTNALEYNAPAAKSAAISNALTTFANVFGRNLNRDVSDGFTMNKDKKETNE